MAYEVTATRKRPQRFESLAGQEFVVSTLKNAIAQGRIAHAYLFSGPRGVGKTTSARLLAKALNCVHGPTAEPCGECENCRGIAKGSNLDVIEIDGASNTGVNDVRVIKEEVLFPPTSSRYKIYIIDEVHMLSQSAFNALLKTIEEPPEYVVFIFATTETQKVPATIRSRCQQFNFQLIPLETIKGLLAEAASEMGIEAEDEALFWVAKEATGSMRDAYTLFDQVVAFSNGKITLAQIREKLGLVGVDRINAVMQDILAKNQSASLDKIHTLLAKGVSIEQIIKDFTDYFRSLLLIKKGVKSENVLGEQVASFPLDIQNAFNEEQLEAALDMFLNLYRDIRYSLNPRFELELAISKLSKLRYVASTASIIEQLARLKNDLINGTISPQNPLLADQKTVEPESYSNNQVQAPVAEPVAHAEQKPVETPVSKVEMEPQKPAPQPEPEEAPVAKQETPAPVQAAAPEPMANITMQSLGDALPQGVEAVENTDNGLVLTFTSKFFYQVAYRNIKNIREDINAKVGSDVNVVLSYSERQDTPAPAPSVEPSVEARQTAEPAPVQPEPPVQETPTPKTTEQIFTEMKPQVQQPKAVEEPETKQEIEEPEKAASASKMSDEQRNLVSDLIIAFAGREEK
ncbi:MAG: DNA polymerase III subunit gamma/tau [Sphaerochaetaceae bacterium]|nr:DNA polymerase III subunit gamma/tau [Sphaerochaetaceae bacterium]